MINRTTSDNLLVRFFFSIIKGCLIGILGGAISEGIGGCIYWISSEIFYQKIYTHIDLIGLVTQRIVSIGIPVGFLIGAITGLHYAIFGKSGLKPFAWAAITCLATLSGLWLSGFGVQSQPGLIFGSG